VLVNIARYLSLDPESALRKTNRKFKRRFQWMENACGRWRGPQQASMDELETLWQQRNSRKTGMIAAALTIRKCETLEEMQAASAAERGVGVFGCGIDSGAPLRGGKQDRRAGDGAFVERELVGFALAIPGLRNGHPYCIRRCWRFRHAYRNGGLGRRMKLYQRDDALARESS